MVDASTAVNVKAVTPWQAGVRPRPGRRRAVASVLAAPLEAAEAADLAGGFAALADPVRLRVLSILAAAPDGEVCVCDFVEPSARASRPSRTT